MLHACLRWSQRNRFHGMTQIQNMHWSGCWSSGRESAVLEWMYSFWRKGLDVWFVAEESAALQWMFAFWLKNEEQCCLGLVSVKICLGMASIDSYFGKQVCIFSHRGIHLADLSCTAISRAKREQTVSTEKNSWRCSHTCTSFQTGERSYTSQPCHTVTVIIACMYEVLNMGFRRVILLQLNRND